MRSSISLARDWSRTMFCNKSIERSRSLVIPISSELAQKQATLEEQETIAEAAIAYCKKRRLGIRDRAYPGYFGNRAENAEPGRQAEAYAVSSQARVVGENIEVTRSFTGPAVQLSSRSACGRSAASHRRPGSVSRYCRHLRARSGSRVHRCVRLRIDSGNCRIANA